MPAAASADVFGYCIFESYADAAVLNNARGAVTDYLRGRRILPLSWKVISVGEFPSKITAMRGRRTSVDVRLFPRGT